MPDPLRQFMYSSTSGRDDTAFRRFLRHFDWALFGGVAFITALGLVMVYSASLRFGHPGIFLGKQVLAALIGFGILALLAFVNYQVFLQYPGVVYWVSIALLILVLIFGKTFHGTKAWFVFGPLSFQPSEICKLFTILVLGAWCDKHQKDLKQLRGLVVPFLIVASHTGLIMLQPDFGSTLVYYPALLGILFVAGARLSHILAVVLYGSVMAGLVLMHTYLALTPSLIQGSPILKFLFKGMTLGREFVLVQGILGVLFALVWWFQREMRLRIPGLFFTIAFLLVGVACLSSAVVTHAMKDYQRKRLIVFFNPGIDPSGAGYHVIQSVVALGSGRIFGKGLFAGTQSRLGFLPEQHTDFIFSVVGEELGFVTSGFVLLLYLLLLWRIIVIAGDSRDRFGSFVAVGIGSMFAFYAILNLAMVMGMAPVTGLPLPFLSYGGSSLISSLAAVGVLLSIHARRYTY